MVAMPMTELITKNQGHAVDVRTWQALYAQACLMIGLIGKHGIQHYGSRPVNLSSSEGQEP